MILCIFSAPTQLTLTSPNAYFTGNVYSNNNLLATQAWVNSKYYLTSSPPQLTLGKLMGNPIVSWTSNNCYIQC